MGLRNSPESETARIRTSEVSNFCSVACHFHSGDVSTPVDKTTMVFFPRTVPSQSIADARLEDKFKSLKPSMKFKFSKAKRAAGLLAVKSSSSSGSLE